MFENRRIIERAREIAERHREPESPYLRRPIRTLEQAEADIASQRKRFQSLIHGCPSTFVGGR